MKKNIKMICLMLAAVFAVTACGGNADNTENGYNETGTEITEDIDNGEDVDDEEEIDSANEEENTGITSIEGFQNYIDAAIGIHVQYPENWVLINREIINDEEQMEYLSEEFDISEDLIRAALTESEVIWYDFENSVDDMSANTNLIVMDAPGMRQEYLMDEDEQREFGDMMVAELASFATVNMIEEAHGKEIGANYFIILQYSYDIYGTEIATYQAITSNDVDKLLIFTYVSEVSVFENGIEQVEEMLSTLEFKN